MPSARLNVCSCAHHAWQVSKDDAGRVTLPCVHVERGSVYPEEVSAQVCACASAFRLQSAIISH